MMLSRTTAYAAPSRSRMTGMHSSARSPDAARSESTISATLNSHHVAATCRRSCVSSRSDSIVMPLSSAFAMS